MFAGCRMQRQHELQPARGGWRATTPYSQLRASPTQRSDPIHGC
eukprot:CAMPEP_0177577392 /NCGR_PEP_ID=MMETSP0369-20130122/80614_1 /TAXON_ID=447022 ORGANISM="Scrippsiella hangoei-like, Strain SHHI-4" /NCGR_SAMPLE_ID=MMETSP0369 /ASSEMBLY_ACC=CAM_ASM_000364 /LENGTH=43 /DNA_ID= /DNA_START= /DNA_END= /DNA_ORIENTATION=